MKQQASDEGYRTLPAQCGRTAGAGTAKRLCRYVTSTTTCGERRLAINVDPSDSRLTTSRRRLARVFPRTAQGRRLRLAAGAARRTQLEKRQLVSAWRPLLFAARRFAARYRLPLDSRPWVKAVTIHITSPIDQFQPLPPALQQRDKLAPSAGARVQRRQAMRRNTARRSRRSNNGQAHQHPGAVESADKITRTALCAEVRNGVLYLFMPPLARLEDYLELGRSKLPPKSCSSRCCLKAMNRPTIRA